MSVVSRDIRFAVLKRDKMICQYCGIVCLHSWEARQDHPRIATVDHVIPRADGGTDNLANLKTACQDCNNRKGMALASETYLWRNGYVPPVQLPPLVSGEASRELARRIVRGDA